MSRLIAALVCGPLLLTACRDRAEVPATATRSRADTPHPTPFDPARWQPPPDSAIPDDSLGASIRRGLALVTHTADSLPRYAPGKINCSNCHLGAGRNVDAAPLAGAQARFPKYMDRTGAVIGLADRVNYCFTRSLAGSRIPVESREMQDILAYIAWLSTGVPVGEGKKLPGAEGLHAIPTLAGDTTRGAEVFRTTCTACHGMDGQGNPGFPALWGPRSFSVGASMARRGKAASFIWHNMPFGQGKSLTQQQAYDVAAYIDSRPRPDSPGKERDWPAGGAPADVPYATTGHVAYLPPPLITRKNPREAIVERPAPLRANGGQ
ncbi:MAG TPA: c-type cytochrome [Gemmatimonadaceae bacterium]|nr:c-type cytochrome [Gemmatimonadaceae bacterium]